MDTLDIEAKIARNLVQLGVDTGVPLPFCGSDIDGIISSEMDEATKLNQIRRIKSSLHEVLYAPPRQS